MVPSLLVNRLNAKFSESLPHRENRDPCTGIHRKQIIVTGCDGIGARCHRASKDMHIIGVTKLRRNSYNRRLDDQSRSAKAGDNLPSVAAAIFQSLLKSCALENLREFREDGS